jgi:type II secretory pathway pseudopilin PulG
MPGIAAPRAGGESTRQRSRRLVAFLTAVAVAIRAARLANQYLRSLDRTRSDWHAAW